MSEMTRKYDDGCAPSPTTTSFFFTSGLRIGCGGWPEGYDSMVGRVAGSENELLLI